MHNSRGSFKGRCCCSVLKTSHGLSHVPLLDGHTDSVASTSQIAGTLPSAPKRSQHRDLRLDVFFRHIFFHQCSHRLYFWHKHPPPAKDRSKWGRQFRRLWCCGEHVRSKATGISLRPSSIRILQGVLHLF